MARSLGSSPRAGTPTAVGIPILHEGRQHFIGWKFRFETLSRMGLSPPTVVPDKCAPLRTQIRDLYLTANGKDPGSASAGPSGATVGGGCEQARRHRLLRRDTRVLGETGGFQPTHFRHGRAGGHPSEYGSWTLDPRFARSSAEGCAKIASLDRQGVGVRVVVG